MYNIDYIKIFISIIKQKILKIYLVIIKILEMILLQMDIISAYLKSIFG